MIIIIARLWVPALTIYPFILIRRSNYSKVIEQHERIHLRQQREMLVVFAYLWYWLEFLVKLAYYKGKLMKAYHSISMEREAFAFQDTPDYDFHRKSYFWINLIKMPSIITIDFDSPDAAFAELVNKPRGTVFKYTKNYESLMLRLTEYKTANHPSSNFDVRDVVPGTSQFSMYGPGTCIIVANL